jgi:hypothetical protein
MTHFRVLLEVPLLRSAMSELDREIAAIGQNDPVPSGPGLRD